MMEKVKNAPLLRFLEFEGEWSFKTLRNLSKDGFSNGVFNDPKKVGKGYRLINVKDMFVGDIINIENLTLIDLDEKEFLKNQVLYGDILFTRSSLVKEGIAISNVNLSNEEDLTYDGHLIKMRPSFKLIHPLFLSYNLSTSNSRRQLIVRGKTTTMTTIGQEDIGSVVIYFPTLLEQQKIASFLTTVDDKIQQLSKKKTWLEQYKKGLMQQIFSREIRFKPDRPSGGDDQGNEYPDWEEKKAKDIFKNHTNKNHDGDLPILAITQDQGAVRRDTIGIDIRSSEASVKSYKIVEVGDFIISLRSFQGGIEYSNVMGICSPAYTILKPKTELSTEFFKYYLKKESFIQQLSNSVIGIRDGKQISFDVFSGMKLPFPCLEEQTKIANFLLVIDDKINLVSRQLEQTRQYKKGLLQQMFV